MRIVILTAKDHLYANCLLRLLIEDRSFENDEILAVEHETLMHGRNPIFTLRWYLRSAGLRFTATNTLRQILFLCSRSRSVLTRKKSSLCYPWYKLCPPQWRRINLVDFGRPESIRTIREAQPDLILSLLSREILPAEVLRIPPLGCANLHPTLLPAYRGLNPTFWQMAEGEEVGGVTLHYIERGIDTGPIISQTSVPITPHRTEHSFYLACLVAGSDLIRDFLKQVRAGKRPSTREQPATGGSYRSMPTRAAVGQFLGRGCRFFSFREILQGAFPPTI